MENIKDIKFTNISNKDLVLSLDRLTRFKSPEMRYYRVFNDILSKYLIEPKFTKAQLHELDTDFYKMLVGKIWNASVAYYNESTENSGYLNKIIQNEENNSYTLSADLEKLINNNLNYEGVLELIQKDNALPLNLKRLIILNKEKKDSVTLRKKYKLRFPIEKIVLCEGITEEILLPKFASTAGYNFDEYGIQLISAGGKNQVAKVYSELKNGLKLPVFVLLDSDAAETSNIIKSMKRPADKVHLIQKGEFEDLFSLFLIKRTINENFKNIVQCHVSDFKSNLPMKKNLFEYYRVNNLGDFQKADFAKEICKNINSKKDLTKEIIEIINEIIFPHNQQTS